MRGKGGDWTMVAQRRRLANDVRGRQFGIGLGVGVGAYLVLFGPSVITSLFYLFSAGRQIEQTPDPGAAARTLGWTILVVAGSTMLLRLPFSRSMERWPALRQWPWSRQASWPTVIGAVAVTAIALEACQGGLAELLQHWGLMNTMSFTAARSATESWMIAVHAGVGEEMVALAIPATLLRYYRTPTRWALLLLVGIRAAYHLYYGGIGVLWLMPWAITAAAVYWRWHDWRILVGLIALHIFYDAVGGSAEWHLVLVVAALVAAGAASWATRGANRPSWMRQPPARTRSTMWLSGRTVISGDEAK